MATVLLGWENGDGLGHVLPLIAVARALAEQGHQPVFAFRNLVEPWPVVQRTGFPALQAPLWHRRLWRGDKPFTAATFADVLAIVGFERADDLHPLVEGWQALIDLVQPRLIVCDYAPTLCLAAYGTMPVVQVGSWFEMPPTEGATFPVLVPGQAPLVPQEQVLGAVREVQRRRGRPQPDTLPQFLAGDRFPAILPELDAYRAYRRERCWDPLTPLSDPVPPARAPSFFAYMNGDFPHLEPVLTSLALTGYPGRAYIRSLPADVGQRLRLQGIEILAEPAPMEEVLARSAVIVHHGGAGTAQSALTGGRPQLLFPLHLEQTINAQMLARLGAAAFLVGNFTADAAARALQQILSERRFADTAQALAHNCRARPRQPPLPDLLQCCRKYLRAG